ncbi:MAG: hypothetical protein U0610_00165 [bacterium]
MIPLGSTRCRGCGAEGARRTANPGIGVGFLAMGVFLIAIALAVRWYGGVGVWHQVLGWGLVISASAGLFGDGRALLRGGETSAFWIETRTRCGACGQRTRYATGQRVTRWLLLATFLVFGYLRFGSPRI